MKKHILIFFSLFLLLLIPKNVFAESSVPIWVTIDNTTFVANAQPLDVNVTRYTGSGTLYFDISFDVSYEDLDEYNSFPYVVIYFKSLTKNLTITRIGGCTSSCFGSGFRYAPIGKTSWEGYPGFYYSLVLPVNKLYYDGNRNTYRVMDTLRFTTTDVNTLAYQFVNVFLTKDMSVLDSSYEGTTDIITNNNTNTQNIINNNNTNTQNIINNQNTNQQQTHSDITNITNNITSDNIPTDSFNGTAFGEWKDLLPSDTPITDLLLLPVNFLSAFIVGFGGTCQPFNLGNFFGTDLILPCINPATYLGSSLWTIIDIICSGLMCFAISKKLIKIWDDMTDMRDNLTNDLYGGGR